MYSAASRGSMSAMAEVTPKQEWNFAAAAGFLALLILAYALVVQDGHATFLSVGVLELLIVSLATFRLAHLLTFDKVFSFVRDYFLDGDTKPRWGFRRLVAVLLECPWCTGMWSAVITLTLYVLHPFGAFVVLVFAIAGAASLVQMVCTRLARD